MKIFFPGSFNPFTKGHADILHRLLSFADYVIIGIGCNPDKPSSGEQARRNKALILEYIEKSGLKDRVETIIYSGLTGEVALRYGANCMARGVRSTSDFDYEYSLASANRESFGIETLLIPADPTLSFVSSSMIRDIQNNGRPDIAAHFLP